MQVRNLLLIDIDLIRMYGTLGFKNVHPSTTNDNFKSSCPIPVIFGRNITQ